VAARFVELAHRAGVPEDVLSLALCEDDVASEFVRDPRVASVILTGATATARLIQRLRPGLHVVAETGGKNAYIVSAMSDREQAVRDVVISAFGHAGQKCSATSLLILEAEVYDDPHFARTLADAVQLRHAADCATGARPRAGAPHARAGRALARAAVLPRPQSAAGGPVREVGRGQAQPRLHE